MPSHEGCKNCLYWQTVWPELEQRNKGLCTTVERIRTFRHAYVTSSEWGARTRAVLKEKINLVYRACQSSANEQIQKIADELFQELGNSPVI